MAGFGGANFSGPIGAAYARDPRNLYARALIQGAGSTAPVRHWAEGLARLGQGAIGGLLASSAKNDYDKREKAYSTALATALQGGDPMGALSKAALENPDIAQAFGGTILQGRMSQQEKAADRDFTIGRDKARMEYDSAQGELQRAFTAAQTDKSIAAQQALQAASQRFQAAENGLQRAFAAGQQTNQQQFTAGQTDKQIAAQAAAAQAARDAAAASSASAREAPLQLVPDPANPGQMIPRAQAEAAAAAMGGLPAALAKAQLTNPEAVDARTKVRDANDVLSILDMVEKVGPDGKPDLKNSLLEKSTGSLLGNLQDATASAVGISLPGAQAAAQLKAIEGNLVAKMPKMSGPQSDKDVALYKQMAAQIGDPTVPAATKRAALQVIRDINARNAGGGSGAPAGSPPPAAPKGMPQLPPGFQLIGP